MIPKLPPTISANIEHFTGRTWLLPSLLQWFEHSDDRILLLTGDPGTGKSMVIAWLAGAGPLPTGATARSQLERIRSRVAATHFCMAASRTIAPQTFAENVANQLTRNVKGFSDALTATLADRVRISSVQQVDNVEAGGSVTGVSIGRLDLGMLGEELSFDRVFSEPLKKLYAGGYSEPMLLLIDALDEAQTYTGITLVRLIASLTDLPQHVRILATTRPDPRVLKYYRRVEPVDLISNAPTDVDEVRLYADEQLASLGAGLDDAQRTLLAKRISHAAQGIFLYAYVVLNDLLPRLPDIPDLAILPLPASLSGLYHDFLNRELGADENLWYETFGPLLGLLAVAQEPGLTRTQLNRINGKDVDQALRICKQYLSGDLQEGPFSPFHRSFVDFLLEDTKNHDYHIDGVGMHRHIADYYMTHFSNQWDKCDEYGRHYTATHAAAAGVLDQLAIDLSFLVAADTNRLIEVIHHVISEDACEAAMVYQLVSHRLVASTPNERASYLELAARQQGTHTLANRIAQLPCLRPWSVPWAHWQRVSPHRILKGHSAIQALALGTDNGRQILIAGDASNVLQALDLASGELLYKHVDDHLWGIRAVTVGNLDGKQVIVSGDAEGQLCAWDLASGIRLWNNRNDLWVVNALAIGKLNGRAVVVAGGGTTGMAVLDLASGESVLGTSDERTIKYLRRAEKYKRYGSKVYSLTITDLNGRPVIVSGEEDGTVRVWDIDTFQKLGEFCGHQGIVRAVTVIQRDGRPVIVSGSQDGTVRKWDLESGVPLGEPLIHSIDSEQKSVIAIAVGALDGRPIILSGGSDRVVRVWDMASGAPIGQPLTGHNDWVGAMVLGNVDGSAMVISGSGDGTIRVWTLTRQALLRSSNSSFDEQICAVASSEINGQPVIVSGGSKGTIRVWDVTTGAPLGEPLPGHRERIRGLVVDLASAPGRLPVMIAGDETGTVQVWDLASGTLLHTMTTGNEEGGNEKGIFVLTVGEIHGQRVIVTGSGDGTVGVWNLASGEPWRKPILAHTYMTPNLADQRRIRATVSAVAVGVLHSRPVIISSGWEDCTLKVWDGETLALVKTIELSPILRGHDEYITALALGKIDGTSVIISAGLQAVLRIWDLVSGNLLSEIPAERDDQRIEHIDGFTAMTIGEFDGQPAIVVGTRRGIIRVYNLNAQIIAEDHAPRAVVDISSFIFFDGLALAPCNRVVVAGSKGLAVLQFGNGTN